MKSKFLALVPVIGLLMSGCILDNDSSVKSEPLEGVTYHFDIELAKIGSGIAPKEQTVAEKQSASHATTAYTLFIETDPEFPCIGYRIDARISVRFNIIDVEVRGIYPPPGEICAPALDPARTYERLNLSDGDYSLRFRQLGMVDRYNLHISKGEAVSETVEAHFTELDDDWDISVKTPFKIVVNNIKWGISTYGLGCFYCSELSNQFISFDN